MLRWPRGYGCPTARVKQFSAAVQLDRAGPTGHNLFRSSTIVSEAVLTPPTLPGFVRTLMGHCGPGAYWGSI